MQDIRAQVDGHRDHQHSRENVRERPVPAHELRSGGSQEQETGRRCDTEDEHEEAAFEGPAGGQGSDEGSVGQTAGKKAHDQTQGKHPDRPAALGRPARGPIAGDSDRTRDLQDLGDLQETKPLEAEEKQEDRRHGREDNLEMDDNAYAPQSPTECAEDYPDQRIGAHPPRMVPEMGRELPDPGRKCDDQGAAHAQAVAGAEEAEKKHGEKIELWKVDAHG